MLGYCLACHGQVLAQLAEGLPIVVVQLIEQLSPARIGQRFKDFIHCLGLCNQMVACQPTWQTQVVSGVRVCPRRIELIVPLAPAGAAAEPEAGSFFVRPTELLPFQIKCARAEIDDAVVRAQDFGAEQAGDGRRSVQETAVNQTFQIDHPDVLAQNIDRTDR